MIRKNGVKVNGQEKWMDMTMARVKTICNYSGGYVEGC